MRTCSARSSNAAGVSRHRFGKRGTEQLDENYTIDPAEAQKLGGVVFYVYCQTLFSLPCTRLILSPVFLFGPTEKKWIALPRFPRMAESCRTSGHLLLLSLLLPSVPRCHTTSTRFFFFLFGFVLWILSCQLRVRYWCDGCHQA